MDFKSYLEVNAKKIDLQLDLILQDFLNEVKKTNIKLVPFALGLINSCKGGKRIRGVLVELGYELTHGVILSETKDLSRMRHSNELRDSSLIAQNDILKISAAFEILHTAFLIHDDIIDQSPLRRGQKTLYRVLGGDHYGISQAITIGDIGLSLPIKIISQSNFLGEYKIKALEYFSQMIVNTGWGQIMDVEIGKETPRLRSGQEGNPSTSLGARREKDREFIRTFKTAKYTIAGPLQIGAILGGLSPTSPRLRRIKEFGESLGIAFQIQDDILDGEVEVDWARVKALEYTSKAKRMIGKITDDLRMRKLLKGMAEYLVERKK